MAKETTIIFVYDTELLKREEDDPNSAILYFYPTWVSDQQKTALCGQLMGTVRCLKSIFSMPKMVLLQTGKFVIIENNQFLLAVGSDRNIPDWVLQHRANLFYSLINFFHKDFVNLALLYQKESLSTKLYHIFETYLKLMLFGGNIFSQIPMLEMPKSGSTVFMEAVAFLDRCRDFPNALGGTLLYHNKVVATHLSASTTKKIVFTDPYRIKNPAEILETNFVLPPTVQLLQVYITTKEFCTLHESALRSRCILQHLFSKKSKRVESSETDETQLIQGPSTSTLKRDTSLIFSSVAEENVDRSVTYRQSSHQRLSRPNSLNLKGYNFNPNETTLNSKVTPIGSYYSQTSVASTPMTESKIFLHQEILSSVYKKHLSSEDFGNSMSDQIKDFDHSLEGNCSRELSDVCSQRNVNAEMSRKLNTAFNLIQISGQESSDNNSQSRVSSKETADPNKFPSNLTQAFSQSMRHKNPFGRSSSLMDLSEVLTSISNNLVQYSKVNNRILFSPKRSIKLKRSNTIHDPIFPIFKHNGIVASQYYVKDKFRYNFVTEESTSDGKNGKIYPPKVFSVPIENRIKENDETKSELTQNRIQASRNHRKSLTLPLKPLNSNETPRIDRRYSMGVQLTPLMNKLTILAFEQRSKSGNISALYNPYSVTSGKGTSDSAFKSRESRKLETQEDITLQKCTLLVCGQQDMVLGLLLQEDCSKDRESIEKLWELCMEHLPKLEKDINYCLRTAQSKVAPQDPELYSFLHIDADWDTVKRYGPWENEDLNNISHLYGDFKEYGDITNVFLRNPESVIYGHQSGSSQIFYHETAPTIKGLIQPNDTIGLVQHKARKSLERDHSIVLP